VVFWWAPPRRPSALVQVTEDVVDDPGLGDEGDDLYRGPAFTAQPCCEPTDPGSEMSVVSTDPGTDGPLIPERDPTSSVLMPRVRRDLQPAE
jgi:hypothetical protein